MTLFLDIEESVNQNSNQRSFISEMKWVPFKSLLITLITLLITSTSGVSLGDRPCYQNMLIYDSDNKCRKHTAI